MTEVLVLAPRETIVADAEQKLRIPDLESCGGTGIDDVRSAFSSSEADVDQVFMGEALSWRSGSRLSGRPWRQPALRPLT
ncbi:MAG: hypothetical protein JWO62_2256 [Acidimicrobiaceae bacterium]|nr:hypothetical protein [Acidimicrobiaceae bacterium]